MIGNKKILMILGLGSGVMLFFIGIAVYILLGPSTDRYLISRQISSVIKLTGMGIVCIAMIVGGFFTEKMGIGTSHL